MANVIQGSVSLEQAIKNTNELFPSRFETMKRDVVKRIQIQKVVSLSPDRPDEPAVAYHIRSKSWPQYKPYYTGKDKKGRKTAYQRSVPHYYNITLEMDEMNLHTLNWKIVLGSLKRWVKKPPQSSVKTIYKENLKRWDKRRIERHRQQRSLYLDVGDYNSRKLGINADFIFRCAFAYWTHGHLYGRNYYGNVPAAKTNPQSIVFLPKHVLNVVVKLMEMGILKK